MRNPIIVIGATSAIGQAFARAAASRGKDVIVCARDETEADRCARDLRLRYGVDAAAIGFEATRDAADALWSERLLALCGGRFEGVFLAWGAMYEEADARADPALTARMFEINFTAMAQLLEHLAPVLERAESGWICAVSSVAGDRGRPGNYLYGASKAGLQALLSGLRARMAKSGVRVIDVRPGFVDSPLTWGRPGVFLVADPSRVARDALRAIDRDRAVVYTPSFWRVIMLIIRWIPDPIFKRLSL